MLKELNVDVPSLHHIKTLKMPHFIPPQRVIAITAAVCSDWQACCYVQHVASDGTPFYGIAISTIIWQIMGNKSLAEEIARYPMKSDGLFMYVTNYYQSDTWIVL